MDEINTSNVKLKFQGANINLKSSLLREVTEV